MTWKKGVCVMKKIISNIAVVCGTFCLCSANMVSAFDTDTNLNIGIIKGDIWIGPGQNYADVYDNDDYKYEDINVNNPLNIECIQDYIYVIYPADSEFMFNLTMSGFPVPMEPVDTTTIQDYYILKSVNQYDGNFNITI